MQRFLNFILRRPRRLRSRGNFEPPGFRFLESSRPTLIRRAETRNVSDFPRPSIRMSARNGMICLEQVGLYLKCAGGHADSYAGSQDRQRLL